MAGGQMTPRQKMVNLMYLVFIAMLALQMSKEVLSAFGLMNEKFEGVNKFSEEYNTSLLSQLEGKASENSSMYGIPYSKAKEVKVISDKFYKYLGELKKLPATGHELTKDGKLPYEAMDKGDKLDEAWFSGDGYSKKGKEVISNFEDYKKSLISVFGNDVKYNFIVKDIKEKFNTDDIKDGEGVKKKYLDYHFKGFPAISSITKLSAFQNDVKKTEQDIYNALIGNTSAQAASMKNYQAIVIPTKSAFFSGEAVTGKVVLGRYDKNTVPTSVVVNGSKVDLSKNLIDGQVNFSFSAGNVGAHDINGEFTFMEDGKAVPIKIEGNYVVVPKPNSATISADKMNVVYRGVANPMTISFAGIPDNDVSANAPGLVKAGASGKYNINVTTLKSREVTINVTAKLPDGKPVSDKKVFRVKDIPSPQGSIRGETGQLKGPKSSLAASTIGAVLEDFDFELNLRVSQFAIKIPGQPTIIVNGNKLDTRAQSALNRAQRGDQITISEIKASLVESTGYMLKKTSPVIYEITN